MSRNSPEPLIPLQGWYWHRLPDELLWVFPHIQLTPPYVRILSYGDDVWNTLQRWLQVCQFWYRVIGQPMVYDSDYDAIRDHARSLVEEDPDYYRLPLIAYWNHLEDRYDSWVRAAFAGIPQENRHPRYPWVVGEGIYKKPLDFTTKASTISSGKSPSQKPTQKIRANVMNLTFE